MRNGGKRRGSRDSEERSILRLSLSVRATRLAVATHRSIDVATSVVAHALSSLSHPFCLPLPIYPSSLPPARLRYVREGGIIEIARRRVQQTRKEGSTGTWAPLATDQWRPCARFLSLSLSPAPLPWSPSNRIRPAPVRATLSFS